MNHLSEFLPPLVFDPRRVASSAIEGYGYQILQSVNAWLDLSDGEMLFLEGAEDIDVYHQDGKIETIQVKHNVASITLASEFAVAAIRNFWKHCENNKNRSVRLRYLTTSKATCERGDPFLGIPGIMVWEQTRSDKNPANIAQLRHFLLGLSGLPTSVNIFLKTATDLDLLAKLILPITWQTGTPDRDCVLEDIQFKLVKLGKSRPVPPPAAASASAVEQLFWEAFIVATRKMDRALDRKRLLEVFDKGTGVWAPVSALANPPVLKA